MYDRDVLIFDEAGENLVEIVGLTGGIGSGKSIIAEILRKKHRAEIIDTDRVAHELVAPDKPAHMKIVQRFGVSVLNEDSTLNRKRLREIILVISSHDNG